MRFLEDNFDAEPSPPTLSQWVKRVSSGNTFGVVAGLAGTPQAIICNCVQGAPMAYLEKGVDLPDCYVRIYFKLNDLQNNRLDGTPITLRNSIASGYSLAWLRIGNSGNLSLMYNDATGQQLTAGSSYPLAVGNTYLIELHVRLNTGDGVTTPFNGLVELFVDDVRQAYAENIDNRTSIYNGATIQLGNVRFVQVGERYQSGTNPVHSIEIDEAVISDVYVGPLVTSYWFVNAMAGANGTVSPSGSVQVPDLHSQNFTATPNAGFGVADWVFNGTPQNLAGQTTITLPAQPADSQNTIAVLFEPVVTYWYVTATAGAGGTVSPTGRVAVETTKSQVLVASPDAGYRVKDWILNGASQGITSNQLTVPSQAAGSENYVEVQFEQGEQPEFPWLLVIGVAGAGAAGAYLLYKLM